MSARMLRADEMDAEQWADAVKEVREGTSVALRHHTCHCGLEFMHPVQFLEQGQFGRITGEKQVECPNCHRVPFASSPWFVVEVCYEEPVLDRHRQ